MSDTKTPTAPNYQPLITAYQGIANTAATKGNDALAYAKDQIASNKDLTDQVNKGLLTTQDQFGASAKQNLDQSQSLISSGSQGLLDAAKMFNDPAKQAADMGAAGAQAAQADEAARNASASALESYGVNPGSVRFGGLDASARLQSAATRVGAENAAAANDRALGIQANQAVLNQGNTQGAAANTAAGTAAGSGTGAVNASLAGTASGQNGLGTDLAWTNAGTGALTGATNAQNTSFNNEAKADEISNSASSGLGSLAGLGASAAMQFLADGGAVPAGPPGGAIPVEASPSRGNITDDVRAQGPSGALRLNGGEFVMPKDVVQWEGEKAFQNMILKARKAKAEAGAKPRQQAPGGPDPAAPAFQPRPQASGALPV